MDKSGIWDLYTHEVAQQCNQYFVKSGRCPGVFLTKEVSRHQLGKCGGRVRHAGALELTLGTFRCPCEDPRSNPLGLKWNDQDVQFESHLATWSSTQST